MRDAVRADALRAVQYNDGAVRIRAAVAGLVLHGYS